MLCTGWEVEATAEEMGEAQAERAESQPGWNMARGRARGQKRPENNHLGSAVGMHSGNIQPRSYPAG